MIRIQFPQLIIGKFRRVQSVRPAIRLVSRIPHQQSTSVLPERDLVADARGVLEREAHVVDVEEVQRVHVIPVRGERFRGVRLLWGAAVRNDVDCVEALGDVGVEGVVGDVGGENVAAVCVAAVGEYAVPAGVAIVGILDVETSV